jgi:soluble lytic murein transglycosylase-like protein
MPSPPAFDEAEALFAGAMLALRSGSAQLAPTRAREEALKTEKAALEACLTEATKDKAMPDEHLTMNTRARDEALHERDQALHERDAAREAQAEAEAHQVLQQQELDMLTDRLIDRDAALAAIRRETITANRATKIARQQLEQSRKELEQSRKRVDALRGQLEAQRQEFLSSTSWRVSAPVRILGRLIRRR